MALGALVLLLLYWVIRAAVHHGQLDADRSRAKVQANSEGAVETSA
jgi:hypothetical protein